MPRTAKWIALISWGLPLVAAASFGQAPPRQPGMEHLRRQMAQRTVAPATIPSSTAAQSPAAPVTPNQLPSAPPQVSYQNGMLTIVAQNSTLGDILREVHKSTGAVIEVPPSATERVVARLGPGPAQDVLASLLNGSAFNYVMVGSATDPATLASVTLTMKSSGGGSQTVANAYQPPQQFAQPEGIQIAPGMGPGGPVVQQPANDEEADAEDPDAEEEEQDQADAGGTAAQDGSQPNSGPKTPEEMLEMLRKRAPIPPGQNGPVPIPQMPPPNQQSPDNE